MNPRRILVLRPRLNLIYETWRIHHQHHVFARDACLWESRALRVAPSKQRRKLTRQKSAPSFSPRYLNSMPADCA